MITTLPETETKTHPDTWVWATLAIGLAAFAATALATLNIVLA